MKETEMGYRGSKSGSLKRSVKEQRVDGSWLLNKLAVPVRSLRCTLMGFERNYQIKVLSKQLNQNFFFSSATLPLGKDGGGARKFNSLKLG